MIEQSGKEQDEEELHQTKPKTDEHEKKETLGSVFVLFFFLHRNQ